MPLGSRQQSIVNPLDQLTGERNGPCLPHLRSEYVGDAGFWDKRVGCSLNRWLWSIPSSWLPDGSIVPMTAVFLFPLRQLGQTQLPGCRNRARLCALSDLISAVSRCWHELPTSPSLRMLCASWPWQPREEMGFCAETMCYQVGLETSCLFCLFIKHQL